MKTYVNNATLAVSTAVLLACAWVGSSSSAFGDEDVRSEVVHFGDLNMNTPEGVQTLYKRIHAAAGRVCGAAENDPVLIPGDRVCARKAEVQAVAKVNLPQLTAYYRVKTGDRTEPLIAGR